MEVRTFKWTFWKKNFDYYWQADNSENICGYNARKYGQQNVTGPYGPTTLHMNLVCGTYCKTELESCSCKALLESLLQQDVVKDVVAIQGVFAAYPAIAGCRCYLGASARMGFDFVELDSKKNKFRFFRFTVA